MKYGNRVFAQLSDVLKHPIQLDYLRDEKSIAKNSAEEIASKAIMKKIIHGVLSPFGLTLLKKSTVENMGPDSIERYLVDAKRLQGFCSTLLDSASEVNSVYNLFADNESREVLDSYLKYYFSLAWAPHATGHFTFSGFPTAEFLSRVDLSSGNIPPMDTILGETAWKSVLYCTFIKGQYTLPGICEVEPGDVVVDVGAFVGETAIYFASKLNGEGVVYALEPVCSTAKIATANINHSGFEQRITVVNFAAGSQEKKLFIDCGGDLGHTAHLSDTEGQAVDVVPIDKFVAQCGTPVDFIKMDIEGAELDALKGASETIRNYTPKLAICLYHKPEDLYEIPFFIRSLNNKYKFYLRDFGELVLFCCP